MLTTYVYDLGRERAAVSSSDILVSRDSRNKFKHELQITSKRLSYGSAGYLIDSLCV